MLFINVFCIYTIAWCFLRNDKFFRLCKSFLCESLNKCTKQYFFAVRWEVVGSTDFWEIIFVHEVSDDDYAIIFCEWRGFWVALKSVGEI